MDTLSSLHGRCVVLGVTGGIAAYKSCEIVSRLRKAGASVFVVMTRHACEFVTPLSFETLSGNPCAVDLFDRPATWEIEHIALAKRGDLFLVAPATANFIGKLANGIADDMLTTTCMATRAPILLAPAMNTGMWEAEATRNNMKTLLNRGVFSVGPEGGLLACGDTGPGRMSEPCDIVDACGRILKKDCDLKGLRVLVTAGPTREAIDPVRYITNRSSGRMGCEIAAAAARRGAAVTLIAGPVSAELPRDAEIVSVTTTQEMYEAVTARAKDQDLVIQAAAPADFRAEQAADHKIKKNGSEGLVLRLSPTPDIAKAVGENRRESQVLVGFAAETENLLENARGKLERKHLDMIVANDVTMEGAGFDVDTNIAAIVTRGGSEQLPLMKKARLADVILDRALALRGKV